jgi:hypothetical protein
MRTPYSPSRARRMASSCDWPRNQVVGYGRAGVGRAGSLIHCSMTKRPSRCTRIGVGPCPSASTASITPRSSKTSSVRGWIPSPREPSKKRAEHKADFSDPDAIRYHVAIYWRVYHDHAATFLALRQAALVDENFARTYREFGRGQSDNLRDHLDHVPNLPASPEVSMTVLTAMLDGFTQMWPEMPEDEATEVITRFVYRALNGKDYPQGD